jgi:RNA polymerase sigma factor (sigma-70 family)
MQGIERAVLANLEAFVGFARKRLGDPHLAEDVVQESLLKALKAQRQPATTEECVAWFYRILRRAIIDVYRRQGARGRALEKFKNEFDEMPSPAVERQLCGCFVRLLPELPEPYREALQQVDLGHRSPTEAAAALGINVNQFNVRLHRARKRLRAELVKVCKACSRHGCLDCTCGT